MKEIVRIGCDLLMKKNSYKDIVIYTIVILAILSLHEMNLYGEAVMSIMLIAALAIFIAYNFRNGIKKLFAKK